MIQDVVWSCNGGVNGPRFGILTLLLLSFQLFRVVVKMWLTFNTFSFSLSHMRYMSRCWPDHKFDHSSAITLGFVSALLHSPKVGGSFSNHHKCPNKNSLSPLAVCYNNNSNCRCVLANS